VDFRRGIDGMCRVCRQILSSDPFSGAVFVFRSRRGTAIKILAYVIEDEALALLRDGATHVARDRAVAPEDLRAAVVPLLAAAARRKGRPNVQPGEWLATRL
jgi:transposase